LRQSKRAIVLDLLLEDVEGGKPALAEVGSALTRARSTA
jgi:hypothetical protein